MYSMADTTALCQINENLYTVHSWDLYMCILHCALVAGAFSMHPLEVIC